jgi:phosphoribosylaminoimidazole (AIR) synthetase
MYKIFNCGIGLIISVNHKEVDKILSKIKTFKADMIGKIIPGNGRVIIDSAFSNKKIIL